MPQHSLRPYYRVRLAIAGVPTIRRASARSFAPALLTLPQVASSAAGSLSANRRSAAGCALAPKLASSAPLSSRARTSSLASRLRRLHDLLASDSSLVRTSRASNAFPNSRGAGHWCALAAQHPARLVFASAAAAFAGASPARVCVLAPPTTHVSTDRNISFSPPCSTSGPPLCSLSTSTHASRTSTRSCTSTRTHASSTSTS